MARMAPPLRPPRPGGLISPLPRSTRSCPRAVTGRRWAAGTGWTPAVHILTWGWVAAIGRRRGAAEGLTMSEPESPSSPEDRVFANLSPVAELFPGAELLLAELSPIPDLLPLAEEAMLDTTREQVVWWGTTVGASDVQPLHIKNTSTTEAMSLSLDMAEGSVFKFQTVPKPSSSVELTVPPSSEQNVHVVFSPTEATTHQDSVIIRPTAQPNSLSAVVPLSGYAGSSNVQISVNGRDQAGACLSLDSTAADGSRLAGFTIANSGLRAAYIKLLVFSDASCQRPLPGHLAAVLPAQLVLQPGQTRQLTAAAPPLPLALEVGTVLVLCGDELLRRELRHCWPAGAPPPPHAPPHLQGVQFQAVFEGEQEVTADGPLGISANKLQEMFFTNMRQTKLPLKYLESKPVVAAPPPPRLQELRAAAPQARNGGYSNPGQAIAQEPAPRQMAPLELTKHGPLPAAAAGAAAAGAAAGASGSGPRPARAPPAPVPAPAGDSNWWPQPPGVEQVVADNGQHKLRLSTNHLMFARTPLGVPRSMPLQLTNLADDVLKWNIFGYSVPYLVQGVEKMVKCGYDVFKMRPQDGEVKPGQTMHLQVTFSPPYPGQLTQLFQMLCKPAKEIPGQPMVVYTLPVHVSGRGSVLDEGENESDLLTAPLHVSEDNLFFGHWSICHKLEVTNKTRQDHDVEYHVSGPFKVVSGPNEHSMTELTEGCMLAPSQRYVQMSVYFCPERAGAFSGELKLWLKGAQWRHLVRLEGTCEDVDALRLSQLPAEQ